MKTSLIACAAFFLVSLLFFIEHREEIKYVSFPSEDVTIFGKTFSIWKKVGMQKGTEDTIAEIRKAYERAPAGDQHTAGHIAALSLLVSVPIESSLHLCGNGDTFSGGCQHELIGNTLLIQGITEASRILQFCKGHDAYIECAHAVGHALMEAEEKTPAGILQALSVCGKFEEEKADKSVVGCTGGIFMEYHGFPLFSLSGESLRRPLIAENFHEPCSFFTGVAKKGCYFWQPLWWRAVLPVEVSQEKTYVAMGKLCATLSGIDRQDCFAGVGYRAIGDFGEEGASNKVCNLFIKEQRDACLEGIQIGRI